MDEGNKTATFQNYASSTDYVSEINNTQVDDAKDVGVKILMYNLIKSAIIIQKELEVNSNITEMSQMIL